MIFMGLPGITEEQMREVDRLMVEEYQIPLELMMEHAGLNFARLAFQLKSSNSYQVIVGSGNNGGGGLVAAKRLASWNLKVEVFIPKGAETINNYIINKQIQRLKRVGVPLFDGLPSSSSDRKCNHLVLDCYLGYGFKNKPNEISDRVFTYLRNQKEVISLDVPSGLDVTSGIDYGEINPKMTMTIAFVKEGLLKASKKSLEELFVVDIGVPSIIYQEKLGIDWCEPYDIHELKLLAEAFGKDPLQRVLIHKKTKNLLNWEVQ